MRQNAVQRDLSAFAVRQVAVLSGLSRNTITRIRDGVTRNPGVETMDAIRRALAALRLQARLSQRRLAAARERERVRAVRRMVRMEHEHRKAREESHRGAQPEPHDAHHGRKEANRDE